MSEVLSMKKKRVAVDVMDALDTKLGDIDAVIDIMTTCNASECKVNNAAFAIQHMVEDAIELSHELYHAPSGGAS